ncbi:DUF1439 domain-containing protein [Rheinheimera sediminis]|uniref:DUF1439 domain-containing protein n=1 Tax=Rheinheimera sp. YQF-1 TaxID=2499626 RepID=UPI000FDC8D5D|nr:DUF1439 domain-containing protein [Rheinheimera sp. YQF-1]RVT47573.1 DUF1439 domain-containing protein [Rheinheimera sp. YQF-1]
MDNITLKKQKILTLALLLLASCTQLNRIDMFSLKQQELQTVILEQLEQQQGKGKMLGLPLTLTVQQLELHLAPDNKQQIELKLALGAEVDALFKPLHTDLKLHLSALPYFDDEKNAIYLKNLNILDSSVGSGSSQLKLAPLSNEAKAILSEVLNRQPIYKLDCSKVTEKVLCGMPLTLVLQPGELLLKPNYSAQ